MDEPLMNRYLVFAFNFYYPQGGLSDVAESFHTLEEAVAWAKNVDDDVIEIFDCNNRQIVWERTNDWLR